MDAATDCATERFGSVARQCSPFYTFFYPWKIQRARRQRSGNDNNWQMM